MNFEKSPSETQTTTPMRHIFSQSQSLFRGNKEWGAKKLSALFSGMNGENIYRTWADVSKINYMNNMQSEISSTAQGLSSSARRSTSAMDPHRVSSVNLKSEFNIILEEEDMHETFPLHVTRLLNEDQFWGCYYIYPELYLDSYSPTVRIRNIEDIPEIVGGVLTRDLVTTCLTYLRRTPILGDFVYIKLDLSSKHLMNIEVLQHYKYLVYLDLSCNYLTDLSVLSRLPYLQFLSVAFNRLNTVLEYETPQWFLSEVHYKFNSVKRIRDLSMFWSITVLDLSHNNIKCISGLESLRYLRHLDLSFNHIQRLENLNHLRLLWLDVSYNNISSFEFGSQVGLWTLLHLEYLNLNENNLTSMKIFSGCTRLRELHARNNRLLSLLELAVYMRQMRRLIILDLRANPICALSGYKDVVINTFPLLLSLDAENLDHQEQRLFKMTMTPEVSMFAERRLLRLLYIEQLSRAHVSPNVPPADTTEVPMVILVGYDAVGKGRLARRLASECSDHVELALQHTTAPNHVPGQYREVTRDRFDDMLLAGEFLTYSEMDGESYGLTRGWMFLDTITNNPNPLGREEAYINEGKVKIVTMDLIGALMLKLRGRRPYLILTSYLDSSTLAKQQDDRKEIRFKMRERRLSQEVPMEKSTLQVLISGRILVTGILNEIILSLPDEKEQSEFIIESECSLLMDSEARQAAAKDFAKGFTVLELNSSVTSDDPALKQIQNDTSLCSLYKESQNTEEFASDVNGRDSYMSGNKKPCENRTSQSQSKQEKNSTTSRPKSIDFTRYASSTWKGINSTKSSKSVTFTSQDNGAPTDQTQGLETIGMMIEPPPPPIEKETELSATRHDTKVDDPDLIIKQLTYYQKYPTITLTTNIRDDYEDIHRKCPGLFWDTVTMDDPEKAFRKVKNIIHQIVTAQHTISPMFDIDFANLKYYPTVQKRLEKIRNQIAPHRLFY